MVSVIGFLRDADNLFNEIQKREKEAEKFRQLEFNAVRNIQRWVRGFLERRHIAHLNKAAIMIQKNWRGYCGRKVYLQLLKEAVEKMFTNFYNGMASKIQRIWRGHIVRLYVYDHRVFKQWLAMVMMKNKEKRYDNKKFDDILIDINENVAEKKAKEHVLFILFKVHHLLRTCGIPGICSILDSNQLSVIEKQLEELNLLDYIQSLHQKREEMRLLYGTASPMYIPHNVWHHKCEEFWAKKIRVGDPSLFAQEKYTGSSQVTRNQQDAINPQRMLFSPIEHDKPLSNINAEPYTESYIPRRDPRQSCFTNASDFVLGGKFEEASTTYKTFKYGPYKPQISKTDMFELKYKKECIGKRKKDGK